MKAFRRVFKYIWPQWPRLITVVFAAILVGALFSLSFVTIIPMLKVMMGEEGLHGWVDRKTCNWRYGADFYVPEITDFTDKGAGDLAFYLLVTDVAKDSAAEKAGITQGDRIIGTGKATVDQETKRTASAKLLEELATASDETTITVQLTHSYDEEGKPQQKQLQLNTSKNPSYIDYVQWLVSFVPRQQGRNTKLRAIVAIILAMSVVTIIRCMARFYQAYISEKIVQVAVANLREDLFAHSMYMPVGFFSEKGTSDTVSRIMGDSSGIAKGLKVLLGKALREPLKAIGTLTVAILINYKLVLIFLACAPATIGLGVVLGRKIKKFTTKSLRSSAVMLGRLQGVISASRVVKVYNRQKHEETVFNSISRTLLKQLLRAAKVNAATGPIMEVLGMIAGSAALLVGVHWVTNTNMQSSSFFGLLILLGTTAESIRKTSDVWNSIQGANAAAERVFDVMDKPIELERPDAIELPSLKEKIEFRNVVFRYPGADRPILNGINLKIQAGHNIAVVGPNGSGKTTLINLLPRFYDIENGAVLIDGTDIRDVTLKSLRNQIGMVTQNVVTFNDSIASNIGYGKRNATLAEIIDAAKRAFAHEFIEPLPEGYNTMIGEHGSGLSGGQLQRIVIARAILKNPPILIFDEAMSQIDADSEAKIQQALSDVMQNRTCFIIAHRFSTVISADTIVVVDDGQIVDQGDHKYLIQNCPLYQNLYETQLITSQ